MFAHERGGLTRLAPCIEWGYLQFMPTCEHKQTEFLMRREGVDYLRCLGCDEVFEADDLELEPVLLDAGADDEDGSYLDQRHRKAS